ncbi:solute carrier family 35 member G1 [Caerostris darwini]|uniref:Solute carrier family 35 member G1 n=1 Tax=Caerostris darwini TaxID=1538125 RepID=A0AAV4W3C9_9ARAC|nr:solute carrier family 35 member G1 [Caerostris darwini]
MPFKKKSYQIQPKNLKSTESNSSKLRKLSVFKGLIFAMLSATSYSLTTVFVKEMKNLDPGQLSFYRFIAVFAISMPDAIKCGENILGPKDLRLLLLIRSILGTTGNYLSYVAYHYLPLGDAATILATLPSL